MRDKFMLIGIGIVVGVLLTSAAVVLAGSINSPSGPTNSASQMYTLQQLYDRINNGTAATKMTTFTEPSSAPGSTMRTLDDLYTLASQRSRPAKTGQTTSQSFATGDDGNLQKGVTWPNPRFTNNGNGTVTDNLTGLIWLTNANCATLRYSWSYALGWVAELNSAGTMYGNNCGDTSNGGSHQTDWRLPNVHEMQSLIHYAFATSSEYGVPPVPNTAGTGQWTSGDPFTGVQYAPYWTSTTYGSNPPDYAVWVVYLSDASVVGGRTSDNDYVWPVRGGQ